MVNNITNVIADVIIHALHQRSAHDIGTANFVFVSCEALTACPFSSNVAFNLLTDAYSLRIIMALSYVVGERFNQTS